MVVMPRLSRNRISNRRWCPRRHFLCSCMHPSIGIMHNEKSEQPPLSEHGWDPMTANSSGYWHPLSEHKLDPVAKNSSGKLSKEKLISDD